MGAAVGQLGHNSVGDLDRTLAAALQPVPPPEDFKDLEDENLNLREQLNASKEKVIKLKQEASTRSAAWKAELQVISEELTAKQALEEEVHKLRKERANLQDQLADASTVVSNGNSVAEGLQNELRSLREKLNEANQQRRLSEEKANDMVKLAQTATDQLMENEEEFQAKQAKTSRLLELFMQHAT